jgi:hypothetical protein
MLASQRQARERCVHFESPDNLPLEAIGKLISAISSEKWIEMYEQSRLMTKAGKARMAKQGAPSASNVAANNVLYLRATTKGEMRRSAPLQHLGDRRIGITVCS